ncbi:DNA-binding transcriptional LysR family regulator [Sporomusaceae bacterium BoRhaA]|uniref:LysR family transcriptional regulator n=1 Tax=Pelorhabdus rhamnosifermentans TaxID=2772457 RepID=UPI001C05F841|nr:LysR family transcriptional regulator [Pelorhabdus rhamnosifermentans]MBU2700269.1 DNA-binding transcriptional LysR family regulator [Pelorhabdus rhamnosifermentans]
MDIRQLKYFLVVAEEGQITKAAQRLHITQPPLSQQIQLLERELGIQLLERGNRNIRLTEAGKALRDRAEQMVELVKLTMNELQEVKEGVKGHLKIGTISTAESYLLNKIQKFHLDFPSITFQLWHRETKKLLELLNLNIIELGIVRFPHDVSRYDYVALPDQTLVAAALEIGSNDSKTICLKELSDRPLMMLRRDEPMIREYCQQAGFDPYIFCLSDDIMPLLFWANAGIGIALIPSSTKNLLAKFSLDFKEIINPGVAVTSAVIWKKNHTISSAAKNFISML